MKTEFRNRAFLPVVIPVAILAFIVAVVALFAAILLWNTHEAAIVLAIVTAGGILLALALAASQDRLTAGKRALLGVTALVPVVVGGAYALGLGGVDPTLLNINREPHVQVPEIAAGIVATNSQSFEVDEIVMPPGPEVGVVFSNEEAGVAHNWAAYTSDDASEQIAATEIVVGPAESVTVFAAEPGEYYYRCDVHPNMEGTLVIEEGATVEPPAEEG